MNTSAVICALKNDGVRTSTASTPAAAARAFAAIVAFVDSRPVPAISGRSRGTFARTISTTRSASTSSSCGASPLEPRKTRPVSGVCIHRSTLRCSAPSSSVSSVRNGVTIGVKMPANRFIPFRIISSGDVVSVIDRALDALDYKYVNRADARLELQAELFLECGEQRGSISLKLGRPLQLEIEGSGEAGLIADTAADLSGELPGQPCHRQPSRSQRPGTDGGAASRSDAGRARTFRGAKLRTRSVVRPRHDQRIDRQLPRRLLHLQLEPLGE